MPQRKQKKRSSQATRLTINLREIAKHSTKLNISQDALLELREYTEDIFIPRFIRFAEKFAKMEGKKTIQERDYMRAKDFINFHLLEMDKYE